MEVILVLLIVVLPLAFKLVGRNLEQAGQTEDGAPPKEHAEDWLETIRRHVEGQQQKTQPAETPVEVNRTEKKEAVAPKTRQSMPMMQEEEKKKSEKTDPKKLVIYSEIMKPKYQE